MWLSLTVFPSFMGLIHFVSAWFWCYLAVSHWWLYSFSCSWPLLVSSVSLPLLELLSILYFKYTYISDNNRPVLISLSFNCFLTSCRYSTEGVYKQQIRKFSKGKKEWQWLIQILSSVEVRLVPRLSEHYITGMKGPQNMTKWILVHQRRGPRGR